MCSNWTMKKACCNCGYPMIEAKKAIMSEAEYKHLKLSKPKVYDMYPMESVSGFYEHYFYCPRCRKEFIYDTSDKRFRRIEDDWSHRYNPKFKLLVPNPKYKTVSKDERDAV